MRRCMGNHTFTMNRLTYTYLVLQVALIFGYGCSDKGTPTIPPISEPQPTLVCNPDSGKIGWLFAITGEEFESPAYRNVVTFTNAVEKRADSGSALRIYVSVPFGATTGPITVGSNGHTFTSRSFRVTENYNPSTLNVVWYDLPSPVTATDSSVIDDVGYRRTWQATISHDTIHIHRSHSFVEGFAEYHFLLQNFGNNNLPRLIAAWVYSVDDTHQKRWDTLSVGILKTQTWDTTVGLSGKFIGRPYWWGPFTFWVSPNNISL